MFKENSAEKLVEYIFTLPNKEQRLIEQRISEIKGNKKKKKPIVTRHKKSGIKDMGTFLDRLGNKLPKDYRFNREEANER